jgi:hypothetical protein
VLAVPEDFEDVSALHHLQRMARRDRLHVRCHAAVEDASRRVRLGTERIRMAAHVASTISVIESCVTGSGGGGRRGDRTF